MSWRLPTFGTGVVAALSRRRDNSLKPPQCAPIFNDPEYGGDRSYGLTWDAHPYAKIVVFGLPKSGNNWVKALLTDYFGVPGINIFLQPNARGVEITHRPLSPEIRVRADFIHGVCLIRDLRDVVASFFHYSQTERFRSARREYQFDDVEAFYYDWFLSVAVPQYRVTTFVEEYASLWVPLLRYERLWDQPIEEMRKLILRWGLEFDLRTMEQAVEKNSLPRLQESGKDFEIHIDKSHFRKGGYGNFENDLPPKIVADINERFFALQKRWGYS